MKAAKVIVILLFVYAGIVVLFESLLGYYALICKLDGPPPEPPNIVLPDDPPYDPQLEQLKKARVQFWGFFKQRLQKSLANLCETLPRETFVSIAGCLQNPNAELGDDFSFADVAKAFGVDGLRVETMDELTSAVSEGCAAQKKGTTTLIEVVVNQELGAPFRRDAMQDQSCLLDRYKSLTVSRYDTQPRRRRAPERSGAGFY